MMFISVNGEASNRQGKQLFTYWRPVILKTKRTHANVLPHDSREFWIRMKFDTNVFCWMKADNAEHERDTTQKYFWMTGI